MIRKKICMLGAPAVGKTSLVRRYVDSLFDERYQRTIGVKIDKKVLKVERREIALMLWDIQGDDERTPIRDGYLRGLDGYILVIDGTRPETVDIASRVHEHVVRVHDDRPYVLAFNKSDLPGERAAVESAAASLIEGAERVLWTSARSGSAVEECFATLGTRLAPGVGSST